MTLMKRKRAVGDAMSVVTRFVNACNRHDADGVYSCLHPDFDSIQPMFPTRNFRGADQVRRNWQAIFDAEPGFRLTVLRSAALDDTVWLELHGAGEDAEVAGVFVMGIQGDRIRWARIYSGLVEPVPATAGAPARATAPQGQPAATGNGEVVEEAIAPVVDIERSGRRRRRGLRRHGDGDEAETETEPATAEAEPATAEAEPPEAVATEPAEVEPEPEPEPAPDSEPVVTEMIGAGESDTHVEPEPEVEAAPEVETVPEAEPEAADATAAHDMLSEFETEPEEEPVPGAATPTPGEGDDHPKWRFGKKR